MARSDISKWISGEAEAFVDPTTPSGASVDSDTGRKRLTGSRSIRQFVHLAVAAFIGALASAILIFLVVAMRGPVEPSPTVDAKSQWSTSGTLVRGGKVLGHPVEEVMPLTASGEVNSTLAMPILDQPTTALLGACLSPSRSERRPAAPQRAWRRAQPRYSVGDRAKREDTARPMTGASPHLGVAASAAGPNPGGGFLIGATHGDTGNVNP